MDVSSAFLGRGGVYKNTVHVMSTFSSMTSWRAHLRSLLLDILLGEGLRPRHCTNCCLMCFLAFQGILEAFHRLRAPELLARCLCCYVARFSRTRPPLKLN